MVAISKEMGNEGQPFGCAPHHPTMWLSSLSYMDGCLGGWEVGERIRHVHVNLGHKSKTPITRLPLAIGCHKSP